jgi:hypothetical protein
VSHEDYLLNNLNNKEDFMIRNEPEGEVDELDDVDDEVLDDICSGCGIERSE